MGHSWMGHVWVIPGLYNLGGSGMGQPCVTYGSCVGLMGHVYVIMWVMHG